ncbi:MAG TPA: SagB/ThcOx family dehydrogenase [Acidobacteriota bacterium]|nr:SagB/ThcOx family dehydrogenase [Acidobacteriota bacterium]
MRITLLLLASLGAALLGTAREPIPVTGVSAMLVSEPGTIDLPRPLDRGRMTLEEAIAARRSVREFLPDPLTREALSQLLWAAQGVTSRDGRRAAPSAGALYPLEIYVVLPSGSFRYDPSRHRLVPLSGEDRRSALCRAALDQPCIADAPAVLVLAADFERTESKYGRTRGPRYVHMEAGHAAQNVLLEAVALGLAAVPVGAFDDAGVRAALALPENREPLYLIPVGRPRP